MPSARPASDAATVGEHRDEVDAAEDIRELITALLRVPDLSITEAAQEILDFQRTFERGGQIDISLPRFLQQRSVDAQIDLVTGIGTCGRDATLILDWAG